MVKYPAYVKLNTIPSVVRNGEVLVNGPMIIKMIQDKQFEVPTHQELKTLITSTEGRNQWKAHLIAEKAEKLKADMEEIRLMEERVKELSKNTSVPVTPPGHKTPPGGTKRKRASGGSGVDLVAAALLPSSSKKSKTKTPTKTPTKKP